MSALVVVPSSDRRHAAKRRQRAEDVRRRTELRDARIERDRLLRRAADARNAAVAALRRRGETDKAAEVDSEYAVAVSGVWARWDELRLANRGEVRS